MAESYVIVRAMLIGKIRQLNESFTLEESVHFSNAGLQMVLDQLEKKASRILPKPPPTGLMTDRIGR